MSRQKKYTNGAVDTGTVTAPAQPARPKLTPEQKVASGPKFPDGLPKIAKPVEPEPETDEQLRSAFLEQAFPKDEADKPDQDETSEPDQEPDEDGGQDEEAEVEWDDKLLARAAELGFDESTAKSFGDPARLAMAMGTAMQMAEAAYRKQAEAAKAADNGHANEPETKPKADELPEPDLSFAKPKPEETADDPWGEDDGAKRVATAVRKVHEYHKTALSKANAQIARLEQAVSVMVERLQKQEAEAHLAQFDRLIEGLGEEYGDALGKGPTADLDEKTEHFRMRKKLIESIRRLAIGYGDVAPGMGDLFRRAVAIEFADKQKKLVTSNLSKKLRDRKSGQFLSKPTQHKERAKTGEPTVEDIKREWEARTRAEGLTV